MYVAKTTIKHDSTGVDVFIEVSSSDQQMCAMVSNKIKESFRKPASKSVVQNHKDIAAFNEMFEIFRQLEEAMDEGMRTLFEKNQTARETKKDIDALREDVKAAYADYNNGESKAWAASGVLNGASEELRKLIKELVSCARGKSWFARLREKLTWRK